MNYHDLDDFTTAYIEAALWSSTDDKGEPLDKEYGFEDIASETVKAMVADCKDFQESNRALIDACEYGFNGYSRDEMAGHDFWLTRNRHGAGFWDRGLGELGKKLTDLAHAYGSFDLYVGDDGKIYGS